MEEQQKVEEQKKGDYRIRLNKDELNVVVVALRYHLGETAGGKIDGRRERADLYARLKATLDGGHTGRPETAPYFLYNYNNRSSKDRKKLRDWLKGKDHSRY